MTPHILVIDDRIHLPRFIAIELESAGYQVSICSHPPTQSSQLPLSPDLIVINWELRSLSGPELCHQLNAQYRQVPIVAITAQDETQSQAALQQGAQACLTKPFSISDLLNTMAVHLQPRIPQMYPCHCVN